jgi:hypothetical protein
LAAAAASGARAQDVYCQPDGTTPVNPHLVSGLDPTDVYGKVNNPNEYRMDGNNHSSSVLICNGRNRVYAEFAMCLNQDAGQTRLDAIRLWNAMKHEASSFTFEPDNLAGALGSKPPWPHLRITFPNGHGWDADLNASSGSDTDELSAGGGYALGGADSSKWQTYARQFGPVIALLKADAALADGLRGHYANQFNGEAMPELNQIRLCKDYHPPPPPPPKPVADPFKPFRGNSDVVRCTLQLTGCGKTPGAPCCTSDDPTMAALLNQDMSKVVQALDGARSPEDVANDYVHELRRTAVENLLHVGGQLLGRYSSDYARDAIDPGMYPRVLAACDQHGDVGKLVRDTYAASYTLNPKDKAANDALWSDQGMHAMAAAAVDIVRQRALYSRYADQCADHRLGPGWYADPSCSCIDDSVKGFESSPYAFDGPGGTRACTGAADPNGHESGCCSIFWQKAPTDDTNGFIPGGCITNGRACAEADKAKAAIISDLHQFPLLAAHLNKRVDSSGAALYGWSADGPNGPGGTQYLGGTLPVVRQLVSSQVSGPPYHLRTLSVDKFNPAVARNIVSDAAKSEYTDFAKAVEAVCNADEKDLMQMPAIVQQVLKAHPEYAAVQECGRRSIVADQGYRKAGEAFLGLGCVVAGILTAGAAAPVCTLAFAGLAAVDYADATHQADLLSRCFTAGSAANVCTGEEQLAAERARSAAEVNLALQSVMGVAEESGLPELIGEATSARDDLMALEHSLSPEEDSEIEATLQSSKRWGNNSTEAANAIESADEEARAFVEAHHRVRSLLAGADEQGEGALSRTLLDRLPPEITSDPAVRQEVQDLAHEAVSSGRSSDEVGKILEEDLGACLK